MIGAKSKVLPGPGLAKLKAASRVYIYNQLPGWASTDLRFLSSLRCTGYVSVVGPGPALLTSLSGLNNVVDGVPDATSSSNSYDFINFELRSTPSLTNVSALNAYARCGTPQQRLDGPRLPRPQIQVKRCADALNSWAVFCKYLLYGQCPGRSIT